MHAAAGVPSTWLGPEQCIPDSCAIAFAPQECTFAPQTGRPPSRQRLAPGLPVEERLQLSQAGRREALERARQEQEREALADCTFAPRLVAAPERHLRDEYTPLHRRLGEEQKRRSAKLAQARLQQVRK